MKNDLKTSFSTIIKRGHYIYYFYNWIYTIYEDYSIAKMRMDKTIFSKHEGAYPTQSISYFYLKLLADKIELNENDVFVDVGSAWGRLIGYLRTRKNIKKFIGVELNKDVAALSKTIFDNDSKVDIISGDVLCNLPPDATVFYLFNPFDESIMEQFLNKVENIYDAGLKIYYLYPTCKSIFEKRQNKWKLIQNNHLKPKHMGEIDLLLYELI